MIHFVHLFRCVPLAKFPHVFLCGALLCGTPLAGPLPQEPVEIGTTPQFFVDDYMVDNRWAVRYGNASKEMILRVFHPAKKFSDNPVFTPYNEPDASKLRSGAGGVNVLYDEKAGLFRMWYQSSMPSPNPRTKTGMGYTNVVSYAESKDGIAWTRPNLDVVKIEGRNERNIVWASLSGRSASSPVILNIPEQDRRGYQHVMLYLDGGEKLVGSHDGIHWDRSSVTEIASFHSDCLNSIVYDPRRKEYVMYCRSKHLYLVGGNRDTGGNPRNILDVGESRRVARMASPVLWTKWQSEPQNIIQADEIDTQSSFTAFYGMTAQLYGDIYWGLLQAFKWNSDAVCQLAFSRDGIDYDRLLDRTPLIGLGKQGEWDSGMLFAAANWVERGDEWWLYYSGWDGPHGMQERVNLGRFPAGNIGLVKSRKEGFISMRGPENGGVIATRKVKWPGGALCVNADASKGELKVRVSDENRKVIQGFDYSDGATFTGDAVRHEIKWGGKSLDALAGRVIRLEFFLKNADIYTFRAGGRKG